MSFAITTATSPVGRLDTRVSQHETSGKKNFYDHAMDYVSTVSGLNDIVKVVDYALQWFQHCVPFSESQTQAAARFKGALDITGTVLGIPDLVVYFGKTARAVADLKDAQSLPADSAERKDRTDKAAREAILNGISWVNALTDTAGNLHGLEVIDLGKLSPFVNGLYHLTNFVSDGHELVNEVLSVQENLEKFALASSDEKKQIINENKTLSLLKIAKCVASIAGSIIGVVSLCFAGAISGIAVIPVFALFFSTIWLAFKVGSYFYEKIVVDAHKEALPRVPSLI